MPPPLPSRSALSWTSYLQVQKADDVVKDLRPLSLYDECPIHSLWSDLSRHFWAVDLLHLCAAVQG